MPDLHPIDVRLAAELPDGSLFAVGGRVRDELRAQVEGIPARSKDLDYVVTGLPLEELVTRLRPLGRVDVVGASFSVVKLTVGGPNGRCRASPARALDRRRAPRVRGRVGPRRDAR